MKKLNLYRETKLIGQLWLDSRQRFAFQYDPDYLADADSYAISLYLPLQIEPFEDDKPRPFFANLLPEGDLRDLIARAIHISTHNDMAMLEAIGGECAGAFSILPEGYKPDSDGDYTPISNDELDEIIANTKTTPMLASTKERRLSLAGAQEKLPVYIKDNQFYLPSGSAPSSHIIKPQSRFFDDTVINEAFCMQLAAMVGLNVPETFIWQGERESAFVIKRYDRQGDTHISRLHQEDFCQALGCLPERKYENEGGPGLNLCFDLISDHSSHPLLDKKQLIEWVIFNYIIGNTDAHAKNISLIYNNGTPRLAPFYDLLCTQVYPDLTAKMSMKIGGEIRSNWVQKRHWERFAESIQVKPNQIFKALLQMPDAISNAANDLADQFPQSDIISKICDIIDKMVLRINNQTSCV